MVATVRNNRRNSVMRQLLFVSSETLVSSSWFWSSLAMSGWGKSSISEDWLWELLDDWFVCWLMFWVFEAASCGDFSTVSFELGNWSFVASNPTGAGSFFQQFKWDSRVGIHGRVGIDVLSRFYFRGAKETVKHKRISSSRMARKKNDFDFMESHWPAGRDYVISIK